jgi:hypothetical protein
LFQYYLWGQCDLWIQLCRCHRLIRLFLLFLFGRWNQLNPCFLYCRLNPCCRLNLYCRLNPCCRLFPWIQWFQLSRLSPLGRLGRYYLFGQ